MLGGTIQRRRILACVSCDGGGNTHNALLILAQEGADSQPGQLNWVIDVDIDHGIFLVLGVLPEV